MYYIVTGLVLFALKKILAKTNIFGGKDLITDLKKQVKDQQEYIDYQTKKIIELQTTILNGSK
jgi:hypothetical protein